MSNTTNPRDESFEERWPTLKKLCNPKAIITHLVDWSENHPEFSATDARNEVHRYFIERLEAEQVPISELIDAVAENIGSITMKQISKMAMKQGESDESAS
jgi:hypothetical protein